jgi:hypothetical protein
MDPNNFDNDHAVLYASCFDGDGFWRVRLK